MFNWLNKKKNTTLEVQEQNKVIAQHAIQRIQALVGVTQADFHKLYVIAIQRFIEYIKSPNENIDESLVVKKLEQIILALKKRRGYLLPLGADSETSFREAEEWSYAVFSAALFKEVDLSIRVDIAKALLPPAGYAWLHRNKRLFSLWEDYLLGKNQPSIFSEINGGFEDEEQVLIEASQASSFLDSEQTENVMGMFFSGLVAPVGENNEHKHDRLNKKEVTIEKIEATNESKLFPSELLKKSLPKETVIQEINLHEEYVNEGSLIREKESLENNKKKSIEKVLPQWHAADFFSWIKISIQANEICINEAGSFVHHVLEGVLILIPDAVEFFLKEQIRKLNISEEAILVDHIRTLTREVKKYEKLIRNSQGSRIHSYCLGKWEDRHVLSGIIIELDSLFDGSIPIPLNHQLSIDPMNSI